MTEEPVDRAALHSHAVRSMPEDRLADAIQEQEAQADRRTRFVASIVDSRTGQSYETASSDPFVAVEKLRLALRTPHVLMTNTEPEADPWR